MSLSEGSSCSFHILFAFGGGRRVNDVSGEEGRNRALVYIHTHTVYYYYFKIVSCFKMYISPL